MARRKTSFLDDLQVFFIAVPWWIGPIAVVATVVTFRFLLPMVVPAAQTEGSAATVAMTKTAHEILAPLPVMLAPWFAGFVFFVWVLSLLGKLKRKRLLEQTGKIEDIRSMKWEEFELLVGEYYRRKGFSVEERGGPFADGGVDVVLRKNGQVTLVQCKNWRRWKVIRGNVGVYSSMGTNQTVRPAQRVHGHEITGDHGVVSRRSPRTVHLDPNLARERR